MAKKATLKGLESEISTSQGPSISVHIPRWLLYSGIGTAALGILAAGYFGLRSLGAPLPPQTTPAEQGQEQQYTPPQNGSEVKPQQQIPGIQNVMSQEQVKATLEEILAVDSETRKKVSESVGSAV